jgi:hypothetical protein
MVLQLGDFELCLLFMLEFCFIYYRRGIIADQLSRSKRLSQLMRLKIKWWKMKEICDGECEKI